MNVGHPFLKVVIIFITTVAPIGTGWTQDALLVIKKVFVLSPLEKPVTLMEISDATHNVRINKVNAGKDSVLRIDNYMHVEKNTSVDLKFENDFTDQNGRLLFLSHDLTSNTAQIDSAEYQVRRSEYWDEADDDTKNIVIKIIRGSARVKKTKKGKNSIEIFAGQILNVMRNFSTTQAIFVVKPDNTGMIFLEEGSAGALRFPGYETFPDSVRKTMTHGEMKQGDVVFFKGDKVTRHTDISTLLKAGAATVAATTALALIQNAKYYDKLFSRKPFWQKPKYYVPAAALLISIPAIFIFEGNKDLPGPPGVPIIHR